MAVAHDGKLVAAAQPEQQTFADTVIATLEALLIEGLEPPQNRRRGDGFQAFEYIQAEDPVLRHKAKKELLKQLAESIGEAE